MGSRLLVYDRTRSAGRGLVAAWTTGARLFRAAGRLDAAAGFSRWADALDWVTAQDVAIDELQFWGHGKWGMALFDDEPLDAAALAPGHPLHARLEAVRDRLAPGALVWLRCCETFGARRGIAFAERLADWLGARVAGHTFVIGFHQSGLRGLEPGARADWSPSEGLAEGTPDAPVRAHGSGPRRPRTITCLARGVPDGWITSKS